MTPRGRINLTTMGLLLAGLCGVIGVVVTATSGTLFGVSLCGLALSSAWLNWRELRRSRHDLEARSIKHH